MNWLLCCRSQIAFDFCTATSKSYLSYYSVPEIHPAAKVKISNLMLMHDSLFFVMFNTLSAQMDWLSEMFIWRFSNNECSAIHELSFESANAARNVAKNRKYAYRRCGCGRCHGIFTFEEEFLLFSSTRPFESPKHAVETLLRRRRTQQTQLVSGAFWAAKGWV